MQGGTSSRDDKEVVRTVVVEKLTHALHILATGKGDARQRVGQAYLACRTLTETDFPPELAQNWRLIATDVARFGPIVDSGGNVVVGSAENTTGNRRMNTTAAAKIAEQVWRLYWAVSDNVEHE
jgi:hypothetical protein